MSYTQDELFPIEWGYPTLWQQRLTDDELKMCSDSGTLKYQEVVAGRRQCGHGPGNNSNGPGSHIEGRIRELITAKKLKLPWDPVTFYRRGTKDVGGMVEVRGTNKPDGELFLKPFDKNFPKRAGDEGKGPVVLVKKLTTHTYYLRGWMDADYALTHYPHHPAIPGKRDKCVLVPQNDLNPMEWLVEWIEARRQKS